MDLWIRSQDKELLIKVDLISMDKVVEENGEYDIRFHNIVLGRYKSKERALEVLDEIQSKLDIFNKFIDEPKDMFKNFFVPPIFVYKMPEE